MEISLENLYVDIGAERVNPVPLVSVLRRFGCLFMLFILCFVVVKIV